jgi:hypothetical protein
MEKALFLRVSASLRESFSVFQPSRMVRRCRYWPKPGLATCLLDRVAEPSALPRMKTLEAAKISAQFAKILDEVYSLHTSFRIVQNGVHYGYLIPSSEPGCNSHELANDLAETELSAEDRREFATVISKGRKVLKPLKNPWG